MKNLVTWQAFEGENGQIDPDKGSVLTVFYKDDTKDPQVHEFSRKETATLLGAMGLTVEYLAQAREQDARAAFSGKEAGPRG